MPRFCEVRSEIEQQAVEFEKQAVRVLKFFAEAWQGFNCNCTFIYQVALARRQRKDLLVSASIKLPPVYLFINFMHQSVSDLKM